MGKMEKAIDAAIKMLPVLVAVAGGLWALFTYIDHANEIRRSEEAQTQQLQRTQLIEAQKPILGKAARALFRDCPADGADRRLAVLG